MQKSQPKPREEHQSTLPNCRHHYSVSDAARAVGVPASWIWTWLLRGRLKSKVRFRCIWVRLWDVQELFQNHEAFWDAYLTTREPLLCPRAVRQALDRWPDLGECAYFRAPKSATLFALEEER